MTGVDRPHGVRRHTDAVTTSTPHDVLAAMLSMFMSGDTTRVHDILDDQYLDHQGLSGRPLVGSAGFVQVVDVVQNVFPELEIEVVSEAADEQAVAVVLRWIYRGPAGGTVDRHTLEHLRVRNGRAIEHWGAAFEHEPGRPVPRPETPIRGARVPALSAGSGAR
jgi:predicted SnoaL-like aldol condensation-catalyzing enzyme